MLIQVDFNGSPYVGVFGRANDRIAILPPTLSEGLRSEVAKALDVQVVPRTLGGSAIIGAVLAMNDNGAVVADFATNDEVAQLKSFGLKVERLSGKFNAAGNNVLCNNKGALVNPDLGKAALDAIKEALGVKVERGTIATLKTVGSAAAANNKGILCHPKTTDDEISVLESLLEVEADIGTVNHGAPYIGAGLVCNTKGAAIGSATTGPELNRIEDALHFY